MIDFVTKPKIRLIGKSIINIDGLMSFLEDSNMCWPEFQRKLDSNIDLGDDDGNWLIEFGARNCYQSWPKKGEELKGRAHQEHLKHLIDVGHESCLEHATFNFQIWNVSRSLTHELVRTRIGVAYSQLSQRYVDSSDVCFIIPKAIQELEKVKPEIVNKWKEFCLNSRNFYEELTTELSELYKENPNKTERRKAARQAARSVLPNATETKIMTTLNGRSVRYFMNLRGGEGVEPEIRSLAVEMFKIMQQEFPLIIYKMELFKLQDGSEGVRKIQTIS